MNGAQIVKLTAEHCDNQEEFVRRVSDAKTALEMSVAMFKKDSADFVAQFAKQLEQIRQTRMATDSELRTMLASLADVRKFFLSDEHVSEIERLKDFVDTCERLKALKESGFLDQIADTILKLDTK